jgi:hypothetical protein
MVIGCAILAVNIYPRVRWGSVNYYMPHDVYEHGWPIPYMSRELVAEPDMGSVFYPPWPFGRHWPLMGGRFGNPPVVRFTARWLIVDVLVGLVVLLLSARFIDRVCAKTQIRARFNLRQLFAITTVGCVCFAIVRLFGTEIVAYPMFLSIHILPNCLVMLSLALAAMQLFRTITSTRKVLGLRSPM